MRIALLRGSLTESVPLLREGELEHLLLGQGAAVLGGDLGERLGLAAAQRLGPGGPCAGVELAAQLGVEGVIGEPGGLGAAELFELLPIGRRDGGRAGAVEEVGRGLIEQRELAALDLVESTLPLRPASPEMRAPAIQPQSDEEFEADEIRVAGEG